MVDLPAPLPMQIEEKAALWSETQIEAILPVLLENSPMKIIEFADHLVHEALMAHGGRLVAKAAADHKTAQERSDKKRHNENPPESAGSV